jgi:hypothetical protein
MAWRISTTVSRSLTGERTGSYNPLVFGRMLEISSSGILDICKTYLVSRARLAGKAERVRLATVRGPKSEALGFLNFEPRTLNIESRLSRTSCLSRACFTRKDGESAIGAEAFMNNANHVTD